MQSNSMAVYIAAPVQQVLPAEFAEINESLVKDWENLPFYGESDNSERYTQVLQLLTKPDSIKPSVLAGIQPNACRSQTVKLIDDLCIQKLEDYQSKLTDATAKDMANALIERVTTQDLSLAVAISCARFVQHAPVTDGIKQFAIPFLVFVGSIYGMVHQDSITQERINMERSAARRECLENVFRSEQDRFQKSKEMIEQRIQILADELNQPGDFVDVAIFDELNQLNQLNKSIDPDHPLQIKEKSIDDFIQQNKPKGNE